MSGKILIETEHLEVATGDGWALPLTRVFAPERLDPSRSPVLIVPGYGMNSHALRYHQTGRGMKRAIAEAGREVWTIDLRDHGASRRIQRKARGSSLRAYATEDVPAGVAGVLRHTHSDADRLALVGVSLGGALSYSYLAANPDAPVGAMVAMSSPLRWDRIHPVLRAAFFSRRLAGWVPVAGARPLARAALPTVGRLTPLLNPYINAQRVRIGSVWELVRSVETPPRRINREMAAWIKRKHLEIDGVRIERGLGKVRIPLLVVIANRDGIVPKETVLSVLDVWGGEHTVLKVGDDKVRYGHADPYVAPDAHDRVFVPICRWLDGESGLG
ncbi:MAG: alpha/beta fold hydrolase [Myxococcota bacterium]